MPSSGTEKRRTLAEHPLRALADQNTGQGQLRARTNAVVPQTISSCAWSSAYDALMTEDTVARRWSGALARVHELKIYDYAEKRALALVYYLIAMQADREVDSVSLPEVRYRLDDLFSLQQDIVQLLDGPGHCAEAVETPEAVSAVRHAWSVANLTRCETLEDVVPSESADDVRGIERATPDNHFEHAAQRFCVQLDRILLESAGGILLWSAVEATAGVHAERSGRVRAVVWQMDHEQRVIGPAPLSVQVEFSDTHEVADMAPSELVMLPAWDPKFVVVQAGEPLPTEWAACVLLSDEGRKPVWRQEAVDALREGWRGVGRLVVLVPGHSGAHPMAEGHSVWADRAFAWADEVIIGVSSTGPLPPWFLPNRGADAHSGPSRLTLLLTGTADSTDLSSWARRNSLPVAATPAGAATIVLDRIRRGLERAGGFRQVPLLVARTSGFADWRQALRAARKTLVGADLHWIQHDDTAEPSGTWWAMSVRIRHPDHRITTDLLVARATVVSIVAYRSHPRWTDSEVVLVESDDSGTGYGPEKAMALPTATFDWWAPGGTSQKAVPIVQQVLGLSIESERIRPFRGRNDSSLLAATRVLAAVKLTDEEFHQIRQPSTSGEDGKAPTVVCRVADLLTHPLCDWATIGAVTHAITSTGPASFGNLRPEIR